MYCRVAPLVCNSDLLVQTRKPYVCLRRQPNGPVMFKFQVQTLTQIIHGLLWKKARVTVSHFLCK